MTTRKILFYVFLFLAACLNIFIIVESCIGGVGSASQSQGFTQGLIDFIKMINPSSHIGDNPEQVHAVVRKLIGHFLLFGLSGILTILTLMFTNDPFEKHKVRVLIIGLSVGLGIAILTELIQYYVPGRSGQLTDMLIDFAGYLLFGFIVYIIFLIIYKKNKRASN